MARVESFRLERVDGLIRLLLCVMVSLMLYLRNIVIRWMQGRERRTTAAICQGQGSINYNQSVVVIDESLHSMPVFYCSAVVLQRRQLRRAKTGTDHARRPGEAQDELFYRCYSQDVSFSSHYSRRVMRLPGSFRGISFLTSGYSLPVFRI